MTSNILKLRSSAKRLKKAFLHSDNEAIDRVRIFIPEPKIPKHADFLHVIACENNYESWPKLKFSLEAEQMTLDQRAERLKLALYAGQKWVVSKLLEDSPRLPEENFGLQIATYNLASVREKLTATPSIATKVIGVRSPILHLAFSQYIHMVPEKQADMLEIASLLVANGAKVNDGYQSEPQSDHKVSALYGALGHANNLSLAEWLLDHGADPDDNESLYHATELGHPDGLKLLMKYSVSTGGTNALQRALDLNNVEAVRLLLEYGSDPNETVWEHPSGEQTNPITPFHQAARTWCSAEIGRLLYDHGADPDAIWNGHTPYALARIYGNDAIADLLEELGHASKLSATETVLAGCTTGNPPTEPLSSDQLSKQDRLFLTYIASGPRPLSHVKALVEAGLDPNETDTMGLTALHLAAWEGLNDRVEYLLTLDPDLTYRNKWGGAALETVIHGSEFNPKANERDHITCAKFLLEAGAELDPKSITGCGREEMVDYLESWQES